MKKYFFVLLFSLSFATAIGQTCQSTSSTVNVTRTCEQMPYYYNNTAYYYEGTYTVTLLNYKGCDSIVTLVINIPDPPTTYTNLTLKKCQLPFYWKCQDIYEAGNYNCAWPWGSPECGYRMDYLTLKVIPNDTIRTYDTVCWGGYPYQWHNQNLDGSGVYTVNVGADSLCYTEELHLTIYFAGESYKDTAVCANKLPFLWNGQSITEEGPHTAKIKNGAYCDSFAVINLTILPNTTSSTNVTICANQLPYLWNGKSYTGTGTYTAAFPHAGCDSVATLNLTVRPITTITSFTPAAGAQGQAVVITGTNFTGATAVSFGGTPAASFSVLSSTSIVATVGQGAAGAVSVTTVCNTATLGGFGYNTNSGNIGIGINSAPSKLTVGGGDVYITDVGSGIIMKSPNGNCWRVTIDNNGNLVRTQITCPQ
ncbi:MAG: IPT/TIG domain-containing protein [Ferruginibacter sp.]